MQDDASSFVINSAIQSAFHLADLLNNVPRGCAREMALDLMIPVSQIAHDILSLPRLCHTLDGGKHCAILSRTPASAVAELVRLSALSLVSTVITTTSGDDLYCAIYRRSLAGDLLLYTKASSRAWAGREQLKMWVLVIQVMMETRPARRWLMDEIMATMDSLSLRSWEDLVSCLYRVAWVKHAAMREMVRLKSDIEERLAAELPQTTSNA